MSTPPPRRTVPDPGFAGDDGSASAALAAALAAYAREPRERYAATLAVLQHERLLVPVVAVLGEVEYDDQGLAHDKTSDMATVLMRGRDGRLALLAFSSLTSLRRWNPEARPVPAEAPRVAEAAVQEHAEAVVVDVAGPATLVVEGEDLRSLAEGYTLTEVGGKAAWVRAG